MSVDNDCSPEITAMIGADVYKRQYLGQSKDDIGKASPDENALALDDGPDASETADQGADPGTSENGADAFSAEDTENAGVFDDEDFSDVIAIFQKRCV